ncbi:MAG TPA: tetratricopeptide repeat protein [Allosphingosinicella sp.]|jgi:Flp pilus assembly protein TadD|nr:tetratricopeptide repeat protein [Allosphingosinicella sp.]
MTRSIGLKVAASTLAIGLAMAAWPAAQAMRPASDTAKSDRQANDASNQARALATKGKFAQALPFAEQAVAASPRDAGYRMLLADLYLKNGRYQSAAATYRDVVSLDPDNQRAALSLALCEVTQGHQAAAVAVLDAVADKAPPADVGLAYTLAGQPQRGIALLEPAAHGPNASGRIRQNLAFAYAMAGDWEKARATAAQDVSPADLGPRLAQWAQLATPSGATDQVAALLGVRPAADSGQPERLALNAAPSGTALAAADPAPAPQAAPEPAPAPAPVEPVRVAAADPAPAPAATTAVQAPKEQVVAHAVFAAAPATFIKPQPAVLRTGGALHPRLAGIELPQSGPVHSTPQNSGRFAVQLGAFSTATNVERAWAQELKRYGFAQLTPFSTTIDVPGKGTLHRLSVAGFTSRSDAERTCRSIRAKGGACFVRAVAGDEPTRWASRYAGHKTTKTAIASR